MITLERLCRESPKGRARGRTTLGVHPLSWLLSNNRLEKVPFVSVLHTSSNRLLLSNQDKGCTPSVAHSLALPLGPALHNVWTKSSTGGVWNSNRVAHFGAQLTVLPYCPYPFLNKSDSSM